MEGIVVVRYFSDESPAQTEQMLANSVDEINVDSIGWVIYSEPVHVPLAEYCTGEGEALSGFDVYAYQHVNFVILFLKFEANAGFLLLELLVFFVPGFDFLSVDDRKHIHPSDIAVILMLVILNGTVLIDGPNVIEQVTS